MTRMTPERLAEITGRCEDITVDLQSESDWAALKTLVGVDVPELVAEVEAQAALLGRWKARAEYMAQAWADDVGSGAHILWSTVDREVDMARAESEEAP